MNQPMCLFTCPSCSSNGFSDEGSHCFLCDSRATTNNGVDGKFELLQQEMATSSDTGGASGSRNILLQNRTQTSEVSVENWKRTQSNDRMIVQDIQTHKQCRKEICAISDRVQSPLSKPGSKNHDFLPETIYKESVYSSSNDTQYEFLNLEKPQSYKQVKEALSSLGEMGLLTVNKNTESNIGILQCLQKHDGLGKISDFEASSVENSQSMDDILAVQGPSDLPVNEHAPNLLEEILHSGDSSKVQSVQPGSKIKLPCNVCDVEIHEHAGTRGEAYLYFCCVCEYTTRTEAYLQIHSDVHCSQKVCNVCSKEYREGNLHDSEHTCKVCGKNLDCKTLLDQHSVEHEEHFLKHCRLCVQKICEHFTKSNGRKIYVCCACNFRTKKISRFKDHSNIHRPKIYCMICREEYPIKEKDLHDRKWTCIVCGIEFKCQTLLEDHSVDHTEYFSLHCRICKETIDKHYYVFEDKFKCCFCEKKFYGEHEFQRHLFKHTNLRLFKCDWCEKRYRHKNNLENHSRTCIPLPYKCKICCARFPCSVSHDKHRLEKHGQTGKDVVV